VQWRAAARASGVRDHPARPGRLTGRDRVVRRGKEVAFLAGELLDDSGELIATATATTQIRGIQP
jgi:acyl-coenzyme A thioesterase PaaI-like protein